jgi:hypothetical protein
MPCLPIRYRSEGEKVTVEVTEVKTVCRESITENRGVAVFWFVYAIFWKGVIVILELCRNTV